VTVKKVGRGLRSAPESEPPTGRCVAEGRTYDAQFNGAQPLGKLAEYTGAIIFASELAFVPQRVTSRRL